MCQRGAFPGLVVISAVASLGLGWTELLYVSKIFGISGTASSVPRNRELIHAASVLC